MRRTAVLVTGVVVGLLLAALAYAQVQDRYQVASDPDAHGYPPSLTVVFDSPPDYVRDFIGRNGNDGTWKGPRYEATGLSSLGGEAGLDWGAEVEKKPSNRQTIIDSLVQDWQPILEGTEPIERRVGGRDVGALSATWVLTQGTPLAGEARYEAGLVFPLCGRTAILDIQALTPAGDSAGGAMGFGEYRIKNMKPTEWNREQVLATIRGISVEGSLPASHITARAAGRRISGVVTDCNADPAAGLSLRLERQKGRRWTKAASGRTSALGAYSLSARTSGIYRVVAGGRRSAAVKIR